MILKDFETVDFFHGEHPSVMYSHRKLLIRKSELLTRHTDLRTIALTFLMSHKLGRAGIRADSLDIQFMHRTPKLGKAITTSGIFVVYSEYTGFVTV